MERITAWIVTLLVAIAPITSIRAAAQQGERPLDRAAALLERARAGEIAGARESAAELSASWERDGEFARAAELWDGLAQVFWELGEDAASLAAYERVYSLRTKQHGGADHEQRAAALRAIAWMLWLELDRDSDAIVPYRAALEMEQRLHPEGHAHVVQGYSDLAVTLDNTGQLEAAAALFEAGITLGEELEPGGSTSLAGCLHNYGTCLHDLGRAEQALEVLSRAEEMIAVHHPSDSDPVAACAGQLGAVLIDLGRLEEARAYKERALAVHRRVCEGDHRNVAMALSGLGICLSRLGHSDEALALLQESLEMRVRLDGPDHPRVAHALTVQAGCLERVGRYEEALVKARAGLELLLERGAGDDPQLAEAHNTLAGMLLNVHLVAEAAAQYELALEMRRRLLGDEHPAVATSLNNLGDCLRTLGQLDAAQALHEQALELRLRCHPRVHPMVAESLNNLAILLRDAGRDDEAVALYTEAVEILQQLHPRGDPRLATTIGNLGGCLLSSGDLEQALPHLEAALRMHRRLSGEDHPGTTYRQNDLAVCLGLLGRVEESAALLRDGARRMRATGWLETGMLTNLGRIELELGRFEAAEEALDAAIAEVERRRGRNPGLDLIDRGTYFARLRRADPYAWRAACALAQGETARAWSALERGRARGLLDLLHGRDVDPLDEAEGAAHRRGDAGAVERIVALRADLVAVDLELATLRRALASGARGSGVGGPVLLDERLDAALEHRRALERDRAQLVGRHVRLARAADAAELAAALAPGELLATFLFEEQAGVLFLLSSDGEVELAELPLGRAELQRRVDALLAAVRAPVAAGSSRGVPVAGSPASADAALFGALFPGAAGERVLAAELLYVVPDAALHRLPLELLETGTDAAAPQPWIERGPAIAYVPSGSVLLACRRAKRELRSEESALRMLAVGDPRFSEALDEPDGRVVAARRSPRQGTYGALEPLPGTRREVEAIFECVAGEPYGRDAAARHPDVLVLLGEDAREAELVAQAPRARVLHVATHHLAEPGEHGLQSALALTLPARASAQDDGFLQVREVLERWRGRLVTTELAVLSACETAAGPVREHEGPLAMPVALFAAGVPTVVVSHWRVDDQSTAELMAEFHGRLRDAQAAVALGEATPHATVRALVAAKRALRQRYPDPAHWAPFVLVGDPR